METYIVVCTEQGEYVLTTRRVFATKAEAATYAATVNESRKPLIVAGRWHQLRLADAPDAPSKMAGPYLREPEAK